MCNRFVVRTLSISSLEPEDQEGVTVRGGYPIEIIQQKTGFGFRRYFICPTCGRKCAKVHQIEGYEAQLYCQKCIPVSLYRYRQSLYDEGGTALVKWHMWKLADKIGITIKFPYCFLDYPDKPPEGIRISQGKYFITLLELQRLEELRVIAIHYSVNRMQFPLSAAFIKDWVGEL